MMMMMLTLLLSLLLSLSLCLFVCCVSDEFLQYFNHVTRLMFDERPDVDFLKRIFRDLFFRLGYTYDNVFDWNLKTAAGAGAGGAADASASSSASAMAMPTVPRRPRSRSEDDDFDSMDSNNDDNNNNNREPGAGGDGVVDDGVSDVPPVSDISGCASSGGVEDI